MTLSQGLHAALLTPFSDGGAQINEDALGRLVQRNIDAGLDGLYVGGSTGEVFLMSLEERLRMLEVVRESANGQCCLIAHVGDTNPEVSRRLAVAAQQLDYDAVSAVPPFYYGFTYEEVRTHYAWLASCTDLPFLIYYFPGLSGVHFSVEQIVELLALPNVVGIKNTCSDYFALESIRRRAPDALLFNGFDESLLAGLSMGADGGIGSTYNVQGHKVRALHEAYMANDLKLAQDLQADMNALIDVLIKHGVFPSLKYLLTLDGLDMGACRPPFLPLTATARQDIEDAADRLLSGPGPAREERA